MAQIKSGGIGAFYTAVKFRCHPLGKYDFKLGRTDIGPLGELLNRSYRVELYVSLIYFDVTFVNLPCCAENSPLVCPENVFPEK